MAKHRRLTRRVQYDKRYVYCENETDANKLWNFLKDNLENVVVKYRNGNTRRNIRGKKNKAPLTSLTEPQGYCMALEVERKQLTQFREELASGGWIEEGTPAALTNKVKDKQTEGKQKNNKTELEKNAADLENNEGDKENTEAPNTQTEKKDSQNLTGEAEKVNEIKENSVENEKASEAEPNEINPKEKERNKAGMDREKQKRTQNLEEKETDATQETKDRKAPETEEKLSPPSTKEIPNPGGKKESQRKLQEPGNEPEKTDGSEKEKRKTKVMSAELLKDIQNGKELKKAPVKKSVGEQNGLKWPETDSEDPWVVYAQVEKRERAVIMGATSAWSSVIADLEDLDDDYDWEVKIENTNITAIKAQVGRFSDYNWLEIEITPADGKWTAENIQTLKKTVEPMQEDKKYTLTTQKPKKEKNPKLNSKVAKNQNNSKAKTISVNNGKPVANADSTKNTSGGEKPEGKSEKPKQAAAQNTPANKAGGRALPPTPQRKTTSREEPKKDEPKENSAGSSGNWESPNINEEYNGDRVVILVKYSSIKGSKTAEDHIPKTTYTAMNDAKLPNAMMELCTRNGWGLKGESRTIKREEKAPYMVWNQVLKNPIKLPYKSGEKRSTKTAQCWMLLVPKKDYKEGWEKQYKKELADMGLAIRHITGQVSERKKEIETDKS